jgi:hypothetical protein
MDGVTLHIHTPEEVGKLLSLDSNIVEWIKKEHVDQEAPVLVINNIYNQVQPLDLAQILVSLSLFL